MGSNEISGRVPWCFDGCFGRRERYSSYASHVALALRALSSTAAMDVLNSIVACSAVGGPLKKERLQPCWASYCYYIAAEIGRDSRQRRGSNASRDSPRGDNLLMVPVEADEPCGAQKGRVSPQMYGRQPKVKLHWWNFLAFRHHRQVISNYTSTPHPTSDGQHPLYFWQRTRLRRR